MEQVVEVRYVMWNGLLYRIEGEGGYHDLRGEGKYITFSLERVKNLAVSPANTYLQGEGLVELARQIAREEAIPLASVSTEPIFKSQSSTYASIRFVVS